MDPQSILLWLAIVFGFMMAWGIGANDVSNAMGTSVGSKAITIRQAIVIAAIFEFIGSLLAGGEVANTIRQDLIDTSMLSDQLVVMMGMLSSLMAAAFWLLIASYFGWPVSTTHTIVGAIIGFGLAKLGMDAIHWDVVVQIGIGWVLSPVLGGILAFSLFTSSQQLIFNKPEPITAAKKIVPYYIFLTCWIIAFIAATKVHLLGIYLTYMQIILFSFAIAAIAGIFGKFLIRKLSLNPEADREFHFANVEKIFSILMIFTACAMAFAHGSNDVANAIGPIAAIVSLQSSAPEAATQTIPVWILLLGASGIVLGLTMYGSKVMATIGNNITQLTPSRGFSATLSAASTVVFASATGLPISTTHTLVGGILGIGMARGIHALNLNVIKTIFMSWIITLPIGGIFAIIIYEVLEHFIL